MTTQDEREAMDAVGRVLARSTGANQAEVTLSNGIVLAYRPVPPALTNALRLELELQLPKVPVVWIEGKERNEENPNDPAYLLALERQERLNGIALDNMLCAAGTDVRSWPADKVGPDDDAWLQDSRILAAIDAGLPIDTSTPQKRKVAYIKWYALETYIDGMVHAQLSVAIQGIREEDVEAAMAGFRGLPERDANPGAPDEGGHPDGNRNNRAARRASPRARSA